tara:strand:- start:254 stop:484 length:231 start_codon:yes stop_codon:yes gene_type:complete
MNNFTVFLYIVFLVGVAGATFAYMWKLMTMTLDDFTSNSSKRIHPEMENVKSGEKLLVFNVDTEDEDDGDTFIVRR